MEAVRVRAITFDFGNTLVPVDRAGSRAVIEATVADLVRIGIVDDRDRFIVAWAEERDRQFREEVPHFREVDVGQRAVRVLARLRGVAAPLDTERWDDLVAAAHVERGEVDAVVDAYSAAFVRAMRPVADANATLRALSERGFVLGILSNWPLAVTVDRFAEAHGWMPYLRSIVVSQRIGTIKPHPSIFAAAEEALGAVTGPDGRTSILHVGDDWAADVVGAAEAGWRTAYLRGRQGDTPLPTSQPGGRADGKEPVRADLEIDELAELDALIDLDPAPSGAMPFPASRA